jgi:hypothetical protein
MSPVLMRVATARSDPRVAGVTRAARAQATRGVAFLDRHATWLALLVSVGLVLALYGRALGCSFLFDDTIDLTRVEGRGYWSLLASSEDYAYYRPIPFLVWKALHDIQGHYDQTSLHALPLIAHATAGWCLYLLVRRLGAGHWAAFPAILFLTDPFSYQNVPIVGTVFHPFAGAAILGSLVLYQLARATNGRRAIVLHVVALLVTIIALWSHESGIVVAPAVVGLEAILLWQSGRRRPSPWLGAHLLATMTFGVVWLTVEKAPLGMRTTTAELSEKALFFLQGFSYPLSAQTDWLQDNAGIPFGITVGTLGLLDIGLIAILGTSAAYAISALWTGRRGVLVIPAAGLLIAAAASAPSIVRLSWVYVENSPRLLYLGAIGAAIFWGLLPSLRFGDRRLTIAWRVVTIVLLVAVVGQSWRFIDVRMTMFERGTAMIDSVVASGEQHQGQRLLVMNVPSWFAQGSYEYPSGHFGVQLIPNYIGLDRVIYASSSRSARTDAASGTLIAGASGGRYLFGPHGPEMTTAQIDALLRAGYELAEVRPVANAYVLRELGRLVPNGADPALPMSGWIDEAIGVGRARAAIDGHMLVVMFDWHVSRPLTTGSMTIVEIRDERDKVVFAYAGDALGGYAAPLLWLTGDLIADSIALPVPAAGTYSVWAGMQVAATGERLPSRQSVDRPAKDGLVHLGDIQVLDGAPISAESVP